MANYKKFDLENLVAIDTHVHLESEVKDNQAAEAARKYFGNAGVEYNRQALADYYRSRKIGCVIFTVDEVTAKCAMLPLSPPQSPLAVTTEPSELTAVTMATWLA